MRTGVEGAHVSGLLPPATTTYRTPGSSGVGSRPNPEPHQGTSRDQGPAGPERMSPSRPQSVLRPATRVPPARPSRTDSHLDPGPGPPHRRKCRPPTRRVWAGDSGGGRDVRLEKGRRDHVNPRLLGRPLTVTNPGHSLRSVGQGPGVSVDGPSRKPDPGGNPDSPSRRRGSLVEGLSPDPVGGRPVGGGSRLTTTRLRPTYHSPGEESPSPTRTRRDVHRWTSDRTTSYGRGVDAGYTTTGPFTATQTPVEGTAVSGETQKRRGVHVQVPAAQGKG